MQMERDWRRSSISNGDYRYHSDQDIKEVEREKTPSSLPPSSLPASGFIEHPVSKFDTLAGIAIKYGVEVADIKKMNGLVTDRQMFALKSLHIPLPGRHPPSPCLSNGSERPAQSSSSQNPPIAFDLFQSLSLKTPPRKVSPAMSSLQGYYGLKPSEPRSEGFEMAVYQKGGSHYVEDGPFLNHLPDANPPLNRHRKSKSLANVLGDENGEVVEDMHVGGSRDGDPDKFNEQLVRRRQKSEADFIANTPEKLLKEDNNSTGGFSAITGKGLALRSKAASRTVLTGDLDMAGVNPAPVSSDSPVANLFFGVRKSSSTPSLQDQDSSSTSSIWPTSKWSLKSDLQALSNVAITRPIFDGLPKPITGRRNKAALD